VEASKEMRPSGEQRKKAREKPQQTSTVASNVIQSPPQDGNRVLPATRSEATPQIIQQPQPLMMIQREQLFEQKRYEEAQKKMVDELLQMKDVEQKAILLQHIVKALQSQRSSRDVLKSPPAINANFGNKLTESLLTKVQKKQNQHAVPHEVINQTQAVPKTSVPVHLSADQLLSSLTTSPTTMRRMTESLGIPPALISEKQPIVGKTYVSRNLEKSEMVAEKEIPTSGNTSTGHDVNSILDTSGDAGSKKDTTASTGTSTSTGSAKRKSSLPDDSETLLKSKRLRKGTKKTNLSDIAVQSMAPLDSLCQSSKAGKIAVKSMPPGQTFPITMTSSDRNVTPVKANVELSSLSVYHPRSITKGIGFVPIKPFHETDMASAAGDSLDVLASVSTSLRTNERSVIQSFVGMLGDFPTMNDGNQQLTRKNREGVDEMANSINVNQQEKSQQHNPAVRNDSDRFLMSADRTLNANVAASRLDHFVAVQSTKLNQGEMSSDLSDIKVSLISDQVKAQIPNLNPMTPEKTLGISPAGLNGSGKKPKKAKKDRQKKEKKAKAHQGDSTIESAAKANDVLSVFASNTVGELSHFYPLNGERRMDENKSNKILNKSLTCGNENNMKHENNMKQMNGDVNALSLDYGGTSGKPAEHSALKHLVPGSLTNAEIPKLNTEIQGGSMRMDPDETSTDETQEKRKSVQMSSNKKSGKKDNKVKPDEGKTKKSPEKKSKTFRANKQEKEKSTKKSNRETENKQVNEKRDDKLSEDHDDVDVVSVENDAIQISSSDEPSMLRMSQIANDATKMLAAMFSEEELTHNKENVSSLETSDAADSKLEDRTGELSSILVKSEIDSGEEHSHNKEDITPAKNASVTSGKHSISEVLKKQKNKTGTSKSHTKKSTNEKSKKTAREEAKNNKKHGKKPEEQDQSYEETDAKTIGKRRGSEGILFINDQSVENFVKGKKGEDGVLSKGSSSRKRKRCTSPQKNGSVVEKKETKLLKKKVKRKVVEKETKNGKMDMSTVENSKKQDEKTDSTVEAKKKLKKAKNESKWWCNKPDFILSIKMPCTFNNIVQCFQKRFESDLRRKNGFTFFR
jgi:hypothetical protein